MSIRSAGVASDTAYRVVGPVPIGIEPLSTEKKRLREIIRQKSLLTQHTFKLASGGVSNYYFDMKATMFDLEGATENLQKEGLELLSIFTTRDFHAASG